MPELPPPLPPAERTVGQLIAESIRLYGHVFWRALPLGVPVATADQLSNQEHLRGQMLIYWALTPLFVVAFLWACHLTHDRRVTLAAIGVALLIYLPFPALRALFLLPAIAWLAFIGLAVPAAMNEGLSFRAALIRGRVLGTADYAHVFGSMAALVVVVGVSGNTLSLLLHAQGDSGQRVALFLSDLVLSPLLFLGGALLYLDQAARVGSRRPNRRRPRDADLHPSVDADATGRPDAQVEP